MARTKRSSAVLEAARRRLAGHKSITPAPDFGPNLKVSDYEQDINNLSAKIDTYNQRLSNLDELLNEIEADEKDLRAKNTRMLSASEAQYGTDSSQYEQVGGTPTSERKRSPKKPPTKG
ncbi:MAG: hypothetical protein QOC96_2285 [Acidobacteriota bacterium]|jgi:uncharacterized phage infection (PIP) family protein YhgE|nr:hypothetical protein [Acidobacteriota bacterium]